jgi:hypothetical protein
VLLVARTEIGGDAAQTIGFDDGSPDGHDPLQIARTMASRGITLVSSRLGSSLYLPFCRLDC